MENSTHKYTWPTYIVYVHVHNKSRGVRLCIKFDLQIDEFLVVCLALLKHVIFIQDFTQSTVLEAGACAWWIAYSDHCVHVHIHVHVIQYFIQTYIHIILYIMYVNAYVCVGLFT